MKTLAILTIALLTASAALASPQPYSEPEPPGAWMSIEGKGSASDPIDVAVILVAFPNTAAGQDTIDANVSEMLEGVEASLTAQSRGEHILNFSIVHDPRDSTAMWEADHLSGLYSSRQSVLNLPPQWQGCWDIDTTYTYMGELQHEILAEIQTVYDQVEGQGNWESPLSGVDAIAFICKPGTMPGGGHGNPLSEDDWGGLSRLYARLGCSGQEAILDGAPGEGRLYGWIANWWNTADIEGASFVMHHEWGHKLLPSAFYLSQGHPIAAANPQLYGIPVEDQCLFGAYEVMRYHYLPGERYPYFNPWEQYRMGWVTPTIIDENRRDVDLGDFRETGDTYLVPIREHAVDYLEQDPLLAMTNHYREYFLVAYHHGNYDYYAPQGTGVMIWHILDRIVEHWYDNPPYYMAGYDPTTLVQYVSDLEIETGLYSDPSEQSGYWMAPNTATGWDTLDNWIDAATGQERANYLNYPGSSNDLHTTGEELSFFAGSNPRSYGYTWAFPLPENVADLAAIRRTQTEPNSIMIRIKDQQPGSVVVDLLLAPYEDVTYPDGGEVLESGDPVTITWNHTISEISTVDILFSPDGGATYPGELEIATGVDASAGQYTWTPGPEHSSGEALIKIVYHNVLDGEHVGEDESDATFVVLGASRAVFDNRSTETGLDYAGLPYSSVGFESDHDDQAQRNLEDLMITIATGGQQSAFYRADGINPNGVPGFGDKTLDAFDSGSVPQVGLGGVSVADMDNDGDLDLFCASGTSSTPRLYENDGDGTFTDVTSTLGLATAASNSWAGTWGDYDGDGWVDLFLARGGGPGVPPEGMSAQPAYLMRNGLDPELGSGGFENVTTAVGLASGNANYAASISACWGDIDNDGRLDLYLAEYSDNAGGIRGKLFVQQSDGTFQEEGASRLPTGSLFAQAAAQFVDMDLDGDLDLVTGNRVLNVGAVVYWNDGTGDFTAENPLIVPSIGGVSGLKVWDQDLDTRPDLLLTTRDPQQTAHFFHNLDAGSGLVLQDETAHVGLDTGHEAGGLTVLDWNRDGDQDMYLGRQVSTQKFFYRTVAQSDGGDDLQADFICVRLSSPQGVNNRAGIGARVSVQSDGRWIHRWVDGGSGRGSQDDLAVTLPVPVSSGTHLVQIQWPNGWTQVDTATVNPIGQDPEIILDETNPMVVDASVAGTTAFDAGQGQFYWVFNWETGYRSDWSLDKVTLPASPCVPAGAVYTPATAGVEHTISRLSTGNYRHVMRVPVTCSAPCQIQFTVESSHRAGISSTSAAKILRVKFCPTQL